MSDAACVRDASPLRPRLNPAPFATPCALPSRRRPGPLPRSPGPLPHTRGSQRPPRAGAAPPAPSLVQFSARLHCCSCCRTRAPIALGAPRPSPPLPGSQEYGTDAGTRGGVVVVLCCCLPCHRLCRERSLSGGREHRVHPFPFPSLAAAHTPLLLCVDEVSDCARAFAGSFLYTGEAAAKTALPSKLPRKAPWEM